MTACTIAQDKLGIVKFVTEGATLLGTLGAADSAQNVAAGMLANWSGAGDAVVSSAVTKWIVGRVAPTSASYTNAPIGSLFFLLLSNSDQSSNPYDAAIYIKNVNGWSLITASLTATSHVIIAAGTHTCTATTIQTITVSVATVGDFAQTGLSVANGTGAVILNRNTATAGFIIVNLDKAGDTTGRIQYSVIRAVTA
jgi:hypothetical protein